METNDIIFVQNQIGYEYIDSKKRIWRTFVRPVPEPYGFSVYRLQ